MKSLIAVLAAALSGVLISLAVPSLAAPGRHHPHGHGRLVGVCVASASMGGIDQDIQVVSSVYTPPCAKGDKFVTAGRNR